MFKSGNIDILDQPNSIYNCNETRFPMAPSPTKVIASKGNHRVYQQGASTKAQITVLFTASTTAHYIPPLIVFLGQNFRTTFVEDFSRICPQAGWTRTSSLIGYSRASLWRSKDGMYHSQCSYFLMGQRCMYHFSSQSFVMRTISFSIHICQIPSICSRHLT